MGYFDEWSLDHGALLAYCLLAIWRGNKQQDRQDPVGDKRLDAGEHLLLETFRILLDDGWTDEQAFMVARFFRREIHQVGMAIQDLRSKNELNLPTFQLVHFPDEQLVSVSGTDVLCSLNPRRPQPKKLNRAPDGHKAVVYNLTAFMLSAEANSC